MEAGLDVTSFFEGKNLLLYAAIFMLTGAIRASLHTFFDKSLGQRLLPLLPMVLGALLAVVGISEPMDSKLDAAVFGLISGGIVGHAYKTGRTAIMGYGVPGAPKEEVK